MSESNRSFHEFWIRTVTLSCLFQYYTRARLLALHQLHPEKYEKPRLHEMKVNSIVIFSCCGCPRFKPLFCWYCCSLCHWSFQLAVVVVVVVILFNCAWLFQRINCCFLAKLRQCNGAKRYRKGRKKRVKNCCSNKRKLDFYESRFCFCFQRSSFSYPRPGSAPPSPAPSECGSEEDEDEEDTQHRLFSGWNHESLF